MTAIATATASPSDPLRLALLQRFANDLAVARALRDLGDGAWNCCWLYFERPRPVNPDKPEKWVHQMCGGVWERAAMVRP